MSKDLAHALRVQGKASNGHVPVFLGLDHVSDGLDFGVCQALRPGPRTTRAVANGTGGRASHPVVEPEGPCPIVVHRPFPAESEGFLPLVA